MSSRLSNRPIQWLLALLTAVAIVQASAAPAAPATPAAPSARATPAGKDGGRWEELAACESGGRWHSNTGNGHYGGLQFTNATWKAFGGTRFAPRADLATRKQQITIAKRVVRRQGWSAWPACSRGLR